MTTSSFIPHGFSLVFVSFLVVAFSSMKFSCKHYSKVFKNVRLFHAYQLLCVPGSFHLGTEH